MINEPAFADQVFAEPEKALAEYHLSEEETGKLKGVSRAQFELMTPDERKSFSLSNDGSWLSCSHSGLSFD